MTVADLLYPVFVQVGLTFVVMFWMGCRAARALSSGTVDASATSRPRHGPTWPGPTTPPSAPTTSATSSSCRCCSTRVVAFALITNGADSLMIVVWPGCSCCRASCTPPSTSGPTRCAGARRRFASAPSRSSLMWVDLRHAHARHRGGLSHAAGAHIAAAVEVLDEILTRHRPAATALADWGKAHRFAGSGDRAAIGNLVYDALRRARVARRADGRRHAARARARRRAARARPDAPRRSSPPPTARRTRSSPLSEAEQAGLAARAARRCAPPHVAGDIPDWLTPSFARAFGARAAEEGAALAAPRPGRPARQHAEGRRARRC